MTLTPAFLDELRARTSLSALVGKSVKLTKAGREYKGCCPFHSEKTPSFYVNDDKAFYHCFGCQAHGDAIRFLTDHKGLGFMDAVKELADAAGMEVPAADPRAREKAEAQAGLHDVMAAAARWFQEQLGGIEGASARAYLAQRGITAESIQRFGLGFAPDSRGKLKDALRAFGNDMLIEAGLLIKPDDRDPYDRFRGRLMIPIRDPRGRVIAFGGRIMGAGEPKYLNSPDTPLFDKGRTLYNLDLAGPASRKTDRLIVVEGYMDVIALAQAGIAEAVAPLGTALTEHQIERLWRQVPRPLLCFDGDSAGQRAGDKAAVRALPYIAPGRSLAFVTLPSGQDPDDLIRAKGRQAMEALLSEAQPLSERLWRHESEAEPIDTPERKAGLRKRLMERAGSITDPDVRDQYRADLMDRFQALVRPPRPPFVPSQAGRSNRQGTFRGRGFVPPKPLENDTKAVGTRGLDPMLARAVLCGLVQNPALIATLAEGIAALPLTDREQSTLRSTLIHAAMTHDPLDRDRLDTILADAGMAAFAQGLCQGRQRAFSFTRPNAEPERAQRDLVLVVDTLAARPELDAAYAAATERLKEHFDEATFADQVRLRAAREESDQRLARLVMDEDKT